MDTFSIGSTVQVTGPLMTGMVGTVVYLDEKRAKYLVRFDTLNQNYFDEDEIELFAPTS